MNLFKKNNDKKQVISKPETLETIITQLHNKSFEIKLQVQGTNHYGLIKDHDPSRKRMNIELNQKNHLKLFTSKTKIIMLFRLETEYYEGQIQYLSIVEDKAKPVLQFQYPDSLTLDRDFKFIRISPPVNQPISVEYLLITPKDPIGKNLNLSVRDISIDDITVHKPRRHLPFFPNFQLKKMFIKGINNHDVITNGLIRDIDKNVIKIRLPDLKRQEKTLINNYIITVLHQRKKRKEQENQLQESLDIQEKLREKYDKKVPSKPKKEKKDYKKYNIRFLVIDNSPNEALMELEKKGRAKLTDYDHFSVFYKTLLPNAIIINPGYLKGYNVLKCLLEQNKDKNIPLKIIDNRLNEDFKEQIKQEFKFDDFITLPEKKDSFEDFIESIHQPFIKEEIEEEQ